MTKTVDAIGALKGVTSCNLLGCDASASPILLSRPTGHRLRSYTPYGHFVGATRLETSLGFNGVWRERASATYFLGNGHRMFSPWLMVFQSADTLSPFEAGGMNAYAYCKGDPVNLLDPTGRSAGSRLRRLGRWISGPSGREEYEAAAQWSEVSHRGLERVRMLLVSVAGMGEAFARQDEHLRQLSELRREIQRHHLGDVAWRSALQRDVQVQWQSISLLGLSRESPTRDLDHVHDVAVLARLYDRGSVADERVLEQITYIRQHVDAITPADRTPRAAHPR